MASSRKRILLRKPVSFKDMMVFSGEQGWFFQKQQLHNAKQPFDVYIWKADDLETVIHYVVDDILDLFFVVAEGPQAAKLEKEVRANFPTYEEDEIRKQVREAKDKDSRIEAIQRLSVTTPQQYNAQDFKLLDAALSDPDPEIRGAGVLAVGYVEWPELRERLEHLKTSDPEKSVRAAATKMLKALAKTEAQRKKQS
jgi:hypothetical protein